MNTDLSKLTPRERANYRARQKYGQMQLFNADLQFKKYIAMYNRLDGYKDTKRRYNQRLKEKKELCNDSIYFKRLCQMGTKILQYDCERK